MSSTGFRAWAVLLLAGAAVLLLPHLGAMPPERAEIYFLDGARAMLERGDWLVPHYRGEPFFDKPALTYWLIAAAFRARGFSAGAARLVPVLATLGVIAATLWLGGLLIGRRAALAGGLVLATSVPFLGFGRVAMSDSLLALLTTLAFGLAVRAYESDAAARWAIPALGAVLGLGFLTKGPIALLLPGLGVLALAWQRRERRPPLTALAVAAAAALFLAFGLGWWAFVVRRLGWEPVEYFFLRENLERFAGSTYDSRRPAWFYLGTYLLQGAPWSIFFCAALARVLRARHAAPPAVRLLLVWLGLMVVPLSLSSGKIDYYLLPFYPALALVVGHFFVEIEWSRGERTWARAALVVVAVAFALLPTLPDYLPADWRPAESTLGWTGVGGVVAALALVACALRARPLRVLAALAVAVAAAFAMLVNAFLPAYRGAQPNQAIVADVAREQSHQPGLRLALCADPLRVQREVLFERRLAADERCDLWAPVASRLPYLLLLREEEWSLADAPGMRHVATYSYLPANVLSGRRLFKRPPARRLRLYANFATADPVAVRKARREWRAYVQQQEVAARRASGEFPRKHRRKRLAQP